MTTTSMAPETFSPRWTDRPDATEHGPGDHGKNSLLGRIVAQLRDLTGARSAWAAAAHVRLASF